MDKKRVLLLGSGQCGNILTNLMLEKDKRYTGLFCNANLKDMENLKNFDINRNVFYIPNATGTGKSRELAGQYIKEEVQKLVDMILKYALQDTIVILTSADGGFGSGSIKYITKAIKKACPKKTINVVGVFPSLTEGKVAFKNTIGFWNDIIELSKKNLINAVQFIDNDKRRTLDEINKCAIEELDYLLGFYGDNIDETDSKRINNEKGYKVLLKLDNKYRSIDDAVDASIKDSVFIQPNSYDCKYLGVSVKRDDFYAEDFKGKFDTLEAPYCGYNKEENLLLLSGLSMPKDAIEIIQTAYKDAERREQEKQKMAIDEDLLININEDNDTNANENNIRNNSVNNTKTEVKSTISSKELNNLFDDEFWDD